MADDGVKAEMQHNEEQDQRVVLTRFSFSMPAAVATWSSCRAGGGFPAPAGELAA